MLGRGRARKRGKRVGEEVGGRGRRKRAEEEVEVETYGRGKRGGGG